MGRYFARLALMPTVLIAVAMVSGAPPAWAHHSYAMFDRSRKLQVQGTVAKFEWTNPHTFVWVYVPASTTAETGAGSQQPRYDLYGFEAGSPGTMSRAGWSLDSIKVGEKVTVLYAPLKDGRHGGSLMTLTHADGTVMAVGQPTTPGQSP